MYYCQFNRQKGGVSVKREVLTIYPRLLIIFKVTFEEEQSHSHGYKLKNASEITKHIPIYLYISNHSYSMFRITFFIKYYTP